MFLRIYFKGPILFFQETCEVVFVPTGWYHEASSLTPSLIKTCYVLKGLFQGDDFVLSRGLRGDIRSDGLVPPRKSDHSFAYEDMLCC